MVAEAKPWDGLSDLDITFDVHKKGKAIPFRVWNVAHDRYCLSEAMNLVQDRIDGNADKMVAKSDDPRLAVALAVLMDIYDERGR